MSALDALQIAGAVLVSLGGGTGIVFAFSSWLGRVWADRIARDETHEHQVRLQEFARKHEELLVGVRERSDAALRRLDAEVERQRYVHSLQFKQEFEAYREIWRTVTLVRQKALALRPTLDYIDPNEPFEVRRRRRLGEFSKAYDEFALAVEPMKPFFPADLYEWLLKLSVALRGEGIEYEIEEPTGPDRKAYFQKAKANRKEIDEYVEEVCLAIRRRLGVANEEPGPAPSVASPDVDMTRPPSSPSTSAETQALADARG